MTSNLLDLGGNLALLIALSVLSGFIKQRRKHPLWGPSLQGLLFGGAAVIGMMRPLVLGPGLIFDGRSVMISLAGLFYGPLAGGIAAGLTFLYRLALGGQGLLMGGLVIAASALLGVFFHDRWVRRGKPLNASRLLGLGFLVHVAMILLMFTLPGGIALRVMEQIGLTVLVAYPLVTLLIGSLLFRQAEELRAAAALAESEARYRSILNASPDNITITDLKGNILMVSPSAWIMFRYPQGEALLGHRYTEFLVPEDRERALEKQDQRARGLWSGPAEYHGLRRDGSTFAMEVMSECIRDADGQPAGMVYVIRDITERRQAEAALRASEALLRAITDAVPDPIFLKGRDGRYLFANPAMLRVIGKSAEAVLGKTDADVYEDTALVVAIVETDRRIMDRDAGEVVEERVPGPGGERIYLSNKAPYRDANGQVIGLIGSARDITEANWAQEKLRESEAQNRAIIKAIPDLIFTNRRDGEFLGVQASDPSLLYLSPEVLLHRRVDELMPRPFSDRFMKAYADALDLNAVQELNYSLPIGSEEKFFEARISPCTADTVITIVRDVTERQTQLQALSTSQDLIAKAFEVSPDAFAITTLDEGIYIEINQGFGRMTGYQEGEVLGRSSVASQNPLWADPRDRERLVAGLKGQGEVIDLEATFRRKDGSLFVGLMSAKIFEVKGVANVLSITRDITDRKRAEDRIRERITTLTQPLEGSAVAFAELFDLAEIQRIQDEFAAATGVASIITRPDGKPITQPSHFTELCGQMIRNNAKGCANCFSSDAVLGQYHPEGPIVRQCASGGLWDAGATISVGGHHVANWLIGQVRSEAQTDAGMSAYARELGVDEDRFLAAFHAVPSMSRERFGQIARALFTLSSQLSTTAYQNIQQARFIAESKRAEDEKVRLQTQLMQVQKMESLGSLAGGVAHDMNNVLGAILGLASANLDTQVPGTPIHQALGTIIKATERGGKMVRGLLSFARQSPAEERELDLNAILREEVRLLERTTLFKVYLVMDLASELRAIRGDASAMAHAFMNLCVNAVDAMPDGGRLTLRTRNLDSGWIEVQVEDTGLGMPKDVLAKALDPYFTTKELDKGTGLGLSMVYSTVKAHQGHLEIESEPGLGTCVRMRFPAFQPAAPAPEPGETPRPGQARKALRVLLVDDDELIQTSVLMILEVLGHHAIGVSSGEEALAQLAAGFEPDAVLLDMNMPGLGGVGTLPRLRALRPTLPVLLSTGRADQAALDLIQAHAHVTLLSKPFSMGELQRQLDAL